MANSNDRLEGVLQIAESKESSAAAVYSKRRQDWEFNRARLDELRSFRDDYQTPSAKQTADQFQSTRQFLSQLSAAIEQQEEQVEQLLEQVQETETDWTERRRERMSVAKAMEKRLAARQKRQAQLEQKSMDELGHRLNRP